MLVKPLGSAEPQLKITALNSSIFEKKIVKLLQDNIGLMARMN